MITHCGPFFLVAFFSTICAPAQSQGQQVSRVGSGLTLGLTPNLAEGFSSDQICPRRTAVSASARGTFALTRIIQLEALGEVFADRVPSCVDGLVPPPPESGPYTRVLDYYDDGVTGPPTVLAFRVGAQLPKTGSHTLRPYLSIAHFSGKDITTPQIGLTILEGGSHRRLLLEVEGWWYSVRKTHLEEEFFDGELVSRSLTERGVRTFTAIFRLGFALAVSR